MRDANYALKRTDEDQARLDLDLDYFSLDAQLRNFPASREATRGRADTDALYRALRVRRENAAKQLEAYGPVTHRREAPPAALPIRAARLRPGISPWFGFSGTVQTGPAAEGRQWNSPGCRGTLFTHHLEETGAVFFGANISGGPVEGHPVNEGTFDPGGPQLWIHDWKYLVPFPAPAVDSTFTCTFEVRAQFAVILARPPGLLFSKIWTGLMPDMTAPQSLADAQTTFLIDGFPVQTSTGFVRGRSFVRRTCKVRAGRSPALRLITTAAVALTEEITDLILDEHQCFIVPGELPPIFDGTHSLHDTGAGRISFHYEPDPAILQQA